MTAPTSTAPTAGARPARGRRIGVWLAIGVVLLLVGSFGAALSGLGRFTPRDVLDPESPGAAGTQALASILREQGVDVVVARDRAAALSALSAGPATLVLPDAPAVSDDGLAEMADAATDVVLVDPRSRTLRLLLGDAGPRGVAGSTAVEPGCRLDGAERSGPIAPGALFGAGDGAIGCYRSGDGFGLLVRDDGDRRVSAVDGTALFVNETLAENGNAALALNLMGRHPVVVWYMPGLLDTDLPATNPSLGELTPPWVSPVLVLLLSAGVAAAIWRARRFGPLVAERLPVTVRAGETTEGRARLYARAAEPVHAADQLRIGALTRMARMLALGPAASAAEIADAAAARARLDRASVRGILLDDIPSSDRDLVALHGRLRDLEDAVHAAVRPERNRP